MGRKSKKSARRPKTATKKSRGGRGGGGRGTGTQSGR